MFIVHCVIGVFVTYGPLILLFSVRVFCICYVYRVTVIYVLLCFVHVLSTIQTNKQLLTTATGLTKQPENKE